ncbi:MAG TPA: hypothetical protein VMH80_16500 [Bryobacteraceae bacterium]|nr:hypothetical protein [Bryobacteraceae bacterium]
MRRLPLLALLPLAFPAFLPVAGYAQSGRKLDELPVRHFLQSFDPTLNGRFVMAFADLNSDGTPEAIIYLKSNDWCGSGGCTTLVLVRSADSWRVLAKISITRPPILILPAKSRGWHSLGVRVQGGGIQPGHEAELRFDGKTYPGNPSVPPARPIIGKIGGEILIPTSVGR